MALLEAGKTCWRIEPAERVSFLVDAQDYFAALAPALDQARRSILMLGWDFDPRTRLRPDGFEAPDEPDEIGQILLRLAAERPDLDIRVLIWRSALPVSASQEFFPHRARGWFKNSRVRFRLDDAVPFGACHHQKVVVIDDAVAFCGGVDFATDRWDTTAHLDADSRRIDPDHGHHAPRHEAMMMVDGAAAQGLADLARERWRRATGDSLARPDYAPGADRAAWPVAVRPDLTQTPVAIVRTEPAWAGRPEVHEWRDLTFRAIAAARDVIYLENQYFTSPVITEALARRLAEPDGPQVVLVSTHRSPSYFDRITMDRTRTLMIRRLQAADVHDRFRAYCPMTVSGRPVIVHSKVMIVDDTLLRIGSSNLNNRSCGFDTECELVIEAQDGAAATAIRRLRHRLAGHFIGRGAQDVEAAVTRLGGLVPAMEALRHGRRLEPVELLKLGPLAALIAAFHLGDPLDTDDTWRVLRRRRKIKALVKAVAEGCAP